MGEMPAPKVGKSIVYEINAQQGWDPYVGLIQYVPARDVPPAQYKGEANLVLFFTESELTQAVGWGNNPYMHIRNVRYQEYQGQSGVWRYPDDVFPPAPTE